MGKILLIVSMVFTLATAALGFLNQGKIANARTEVTAANDKLAQVETAKKKSDADLKAANAAAETAKAEKEQLTGQVTSLQSDLEKSKSDVVEATKQVTEAKAALETAQKEAADLKDKIAAAPAAGTAAPNEAELNDLKAQVAEKDTLIAKLTTDTQTAQQKLSALQAADDARRTQQLAKGLEGQILAVNPAWNFVVLNLGDKNGVASNTELLVKRGNQLVGKVRVTSVEPSTSIADIVARSVPAGTTIAPGDNVIFQGE